MTRSLPEQVCFLDCVKTPIGEVVLVSGEDGALRLSWFDDGDGRWQKAFERRYRGARLARKRDPWGHSSSLKAYFDGDVFVLDRMSVAYSGTPFQNKVWKALRTIPCGLTLSYTGLAKRIREPKAVRAVGLANGSNPIGVIVPCHRVIGSDGSLTGYGGGLPRKRWLLAHDARHTAANFKLEATG